MSTVWVVHWEHYDKSGGALVKAFSSETDAKEFHALMVKHAADKQWFYEELPFENEYE